MSAIIHSNLAANLRQSERLSEAMFHYARAVQIDPSLFQAWRALAQISAELDQPGQAMEFWLHVWLMRPAADKEDLDQIVALIRTGHTDLLGRAVEHITTHHYRDAAALKAVAYVLASSQQYQDAVTAARLALAIEPDNAVLAHQLAYALRRLGRVEESLPYSRTAARGMPDNPRIQYYLAETLLCLGHFREGWQLNAAFYEIPENHQELSWPKGPRWNGEPVEGRHMLIVGEQGLGDQIQFLRFADWLNQQGATVDVFVNESVVELASSMPGVRSAFSVIGETHRYDFWTHMFRIPDHMNLDISMLPLSMPYLTASRDKLARWQSLLQGTSHQTANKARRRVGLIWAGNPVHVNDSFRSIAIEEFAPLFGLADIGWLALQKGGRERESERFEGEYELQTLGPQIESYGDTLAILQSIDLLITVDSSVSHLAGAAGLPVWTLIPAYTDWRWMTERVDSPWYPSMRLFRQRDLGDWTPVIEEVRKALTEWCEAHPEQTR